jgi:hypothetical protein
VKLVPDALAKQAPVDWLGDIICGAGGGGLCYDRQIFSVGPLTQFFQGFDPIHAGHLDIQEQNIRLVLRQCLKMGSSSAINTVPLAPAGSFICSPLITACCLLQTIRLEFAAPHRQITILDGYVSPGK